MNIWYFLLGCVLFYFVSKIVSFISKHSHKQNKQTDYSPIINKEAEKLIDFATITTKHIQNNLDIQSPLIFYEQVFFLYFLEEVKFMGNILPKEYKEAVLSLLIKKLKNNYNLVSLDNDNNIKDIFTNRYENYTYILIHNKYNLSEQFYNEVFEYQTEQVDCIINKNKFTKFCPESTIFNISPFNKKIYSIISENLSLIKAFWND